MLFSIKDGVHLCTATRFIFQIQLIGNRKFWYLLCYAGNKEDHFERWKQTKFILNIFQAECVIFQIGFDIITPMILQNSISIFNFFRIKSFDSCELPFIAMKKNVLNDREEHFQRDLLNWLWHNHYHNSEKYHFRFNLFRIESFDSWVW